MRALRIHERGGPEHLLDEEAPLPTPTIGDALIRVHAASFTPTELTWPSMWIDRAGRDRRPVIPSHEVSGVVTALGYGTTGVSIGDAVYGLTDWYRDGAAAEYVAVEARNLAPKPTALDHTTAAAVPMVALTAMQALFVHGRLERGQRVLVLGAGGGVGSFALQLARTAGAHVIAAARGWARDIARELGAERFVDVDEGGLENAVKDVELVFDLVGGDALARASAAVNTGAAVVSAVEPPPSGGAAARRVFFVVEPNREQLAAVGARMAAGELRPIVGATWPLAEGRAAFAAKQRGRVAGKAVLRVVNDDGGARLV